LLSSPWAVGPPGLASSRYWRFLFSAVETELYRSGQYLLFISSRDRIACKWSVSSVHQQ
jgi:hypothetical protein